jgi:hypothetical protein
MELPAEPAFCEICNKNSLIYMSKNGTPNPDGPVFHLIEAALKIKIGLVEMMCMSCGQMKFFNAVKGNKQPSIPTKTITSNLNM